MFVLSAGRVHERRAAAEQAAAADVTARLRPLSVCACLCRPGPAPRRVPETTVTVAVSELNLANCIY